MKIHPYLTASVLTLSSLLASASDVIIDGEVQLILHRDEPIERPSTPISEYGPTPSDRSLESRSGTPRSPTPVSRYLPITKEFDRRSRSVLQLLSRAPFEPDVPVAAFTSGAFLGLREVEFHTRFYKQERELTTALAVQLIQISMTEASIKTQEGELSRILGALQTDEDISELDMLNAEYDRFFSAIKEKKAILIKQNKELMRIQVKLDLVRERLEDPTMDLEDAEQKIVTEFGERMGFIQLQRTKKAARLEAQRLKAESRSSTPPRVLAPLTNSPEKASTKISKEEKRRRDLLKRL